MTSAFLADWLNLLIRWAHMIAGIGWIGTSFYFIALDQSLKRREKMKEGVMGTAWEVHGGGFYHVEKFTVAPKELPGDLIWFKWEAYLTWMTGFLLLVVQFYLDADAWMIDPAVMELESWQAIVISVASLAVGWFVYDGICRSPIGKRTTLLAAVGFIWILAAAYFYSQVFSGRTALIHVGAFIGTLMAANVFAVIIPNQRKITEALFVDRSLEGMQFAGRQLDVGRHLEGPRRGYGGDGALHQSTGRRRQDGPGYGSQDQVRRTASLQGTGLQTRWLGGAARRQKS